MKQIYDEKTIDNLYENFVKRMRAGGRLTPLDQNLGIMTGHALDALELAKDIDQPLDLFELSEEKISSVMIAMYMYFSKAGDSSSKCRETVTKKMGAYLFFTVCNVCNKHDELEAVPITKGSSLYLEIKGSAGDNSLIDVLSSTERFIKNNMKYDIEADTMVIRNAERLLNDIRSQAKII